MKNDLPFALGTWEKGTLEDGTTLVNADLLGRTFCVSYSDFQRTSGTGIKPRLSYSDVIVRIARNLTGGTLAASDVVQFDVTTAPTEDSSGNIASSGDGTIPLLESAKKKADGALAFCGIVDPTLKTTVAANGLFYVVVSGPCEVRLAATSPTIAIGDFLTSAATGVCDVEAGDNMLRATLGYALQTRDTPANDAGLVLANICSTAR